MLSDESPRTKNVVVGGSVAAHLVAHTTMLTFKRSRVYKPEVSVDVIVAAGAIGWVRGEITSQVRERDRDHG